MIQLFGGQKDVRALQELVRLREDECEAATNRAIEANNRAAEQAQVAAEALAELADVKGKLSAANARIAGLKKEATISNARISLEAANLLAGQGHPQPVNLDGSDSTGAAGDELERISRITDPKRKSKAWKKMKRREAKQLAQ